MITNANLQAILWHAHKKPLIKADHTVTKTLIILRWEWSQGELYEIEYDNSSGRTDDTNSSQRAEDEYNSQRADDDDENDILQTQVSHVQLPKNGEKYHDNHDDNTLHKMVYGPTYVPYNEDG